MQSSSNNHTNVIGEVHDFLLIKKLGRGGFGHVFLALNKVTKKEVVLKLSKHCGENIKKSFVREIDIAKQFPDHKNIV